MIFSIVLIVTLFIYRLLLQLGRKIVRLLYKLLKLLDEGFFILFCVHSGHIESATMIKTHISYHLVLLNRLSGNLSACLH